MFLCNVLYSARRGAVPAQDESNCACIIIGTVVLLHARGFGEEVRNPRCVKGPWMYVLTETVSDLNKYWNPYIYNYYAVTPLGLKASI